jgi:hypothetical protein
MAHLLKTIAQKKKLKHWEKASLSELQQSPSQLLVVNLFGVASHVWLLAADFPERPH